LEEVGRRLARFPPKVDKEIGAFLDGPSSFHITPREKRKRFQRGCGEHDAEGTEPANKKRGALFGRFRCSELKFCKVAIKPPIATLQKSKTPVPQGS
jgi:hypothetical protein